MMVMVSSNSVIITIDIIFLCYFLDSYDHSEGSSFLLNLKFKVDALFISGVSVILSQKSSV